MSPWIFGYGSLVWRPDFPYAERRPATIHGWERRFWQGSTDHRGVPGAPGRVVTLIARSDAVCRGMAYRVPGELADGIIAGLDHREQGGYERDRLELEFDDGSRAAGLVYHATADNVNFLGPAPLAEIAAQVQRATGPSGPNVEYVLRLAAALRELGASDDHVFALAELLAGR